MSVLSFKRALRRAFLFGTSARWVAVGDHHSELLKSSSEVGRERVAARTCDEEGQGNQQLGQGLFQSAFAYIKTVRQMNQKNSAKHNDDKAGRANADKDSQEQREPAGKLG